MEARAAVEAVEWVAVGVVWKAGARRSGDEVHIRVLPLLDVSVFSIQVLVMLNILLNKILTPRLQKKTRIFY